MGQRRHRGDGVRLGKVCHTVIKGVGWINRSRPVVVRLVFACCVVGLTGTTLVAPAFACENEAFRTGRSADLPDCRAYELVTPEELGRTQDMAFAGDDYAIPSSEGEHIALQSVAPIEPNPGDPAGVIGSRAVFSRTLTGWKMKSAITSETGADHTELNQFGLFSPNLSQVAFRSFTQLNGEDESPWALEAGPVGGPYRRIATIPKEAGSILGANNGTATVPALSDVLFETTDRELLPPGPERTLAEETVPGAPDLYEWTGGGECGLAASNCKLVNVEGEDPQLKLVSQCGALLGTPLNTGSPYAVNAVSADGSRVFFTALHSGVDCEGPSRLYMRVDGRETVEVSEPNEGVALLESERGEVYYDGASPNGSEVFFTTETALTASAMRGAGGAENLYVYDTEGREGHKLTLIEKGVNNTSGEGNREFLLSEDGSIAYYEKGGEAIYRYDTRTGENTIVARAGQQKFENEPTYATPNGEFYVFTATGVQGEPRGGELTGHSPSELYRYDSQTKSVMCVSCEEGVAPAEGEALEPESGGPVFGMLKTPDGTPPLVQMSENGQEVFFQTSSRLVPQDTNSTLTQNGVGGLRAWTYMSGRPTVRVGVVCLRGVRICFRPARMWGRRCSWARV